MFALTVMWKKSYATLDMLSNPNSSRSSFRLEEILTKFKDIPKLLQKFITRKIIPDIQRLIHYTRNPLIPRTFNSVENYYRQTEPEQIQNQIQNHKRNTQLPTTKNAKMDTKTPKKNQHPITLQPQNNKKII
jgi:hypothetical protein